TRWVRDHGPAVHGYLRGVLRDRDAADDVLQEVFCRVWESRERYADLSAERGFLLTTADRLARDHRRRRAAGGGPAVSLDADEPAAVDETPLDRLLRLEARDQLNRALDGLSDGQRRTLLLRYFGELGFAEIAHTLECPLGTVLSHARRGLESLRRLFVEEVS
ncbi:MAG: RNA polymerase sigma factor, partial [Planctomycetia bacterium]